MKKDLFSIASIIVLIFGLSTTLIKSEETACIEDCAQTKGFLCENGKCVMPSLYGAPKWTLPDDPRAKGTSLAEKAAYFEAISSRLHVNPKLKWMSDVLLACKPGECAEGQQPICRSCMEPAVPEETATMNDVVEWGTGENDGLFNAGLPLAAESFRYAVTKDPEALKMVKLLMDGEVIRMKITGVPGVFTRQYIPPDVPGIKCPDNPKAYTLSLDKTDNYWVQIRDDGCAWYVDPKTKEWVKADNCGLDEFKGWCRLDNVSKDEYSGHIFGLGVAVKLVDDPEVQAEAKDLLLKFGRHLTKNVLNIIEWDGRVTEHGRFNPFGVFDYPGFNAAMAMSFMKVASEATGDPEITDFYERCMLLKGNNKSCPKQLRVLREPFYDFLNYPGLYIGREGCRSNYNNISMHMLSMFNLIWYERDPELKGIFQKSLDEDVVRAKNQPRAIIGQNNSFFDFVWASQKKLGPGSDGPAYEAVENGIRMLRQFPERKFTPEIRCTPEICSNYCQNRFDNYVSNKPREIADRCTSMFVWWWDPYSNEECSMNKRYISSPQDYLLAYWMGRYFGFIDEKM